MNKESRKTICIHLCQPVNITLLAQQSGIDHRPAAVALAANPWRRARWQALRPRLLIRARAILLLAFLFPLLSALPTQPHPFYVSVTEMEYDAAAKELGIACKIFTDDFELALQATYHKKTDLYDTAGRSAAQLIASYIGAHLHVSADGKPLALKYLGYEIEGEAAWSYFSVNALAPFQKLEIRNDLLYETRKEQINMMHVSINGRKQSARVSYPDKYLLFQF